MINRKVVSLEAPVEAKVNEVRQDTTSLLEELKTTVAANPGEPGKDVAGHGKDE